MGQTVSLVCESYGGNPLATIIWYKNGQRIDHSYTTMGSKSKNVLRFVAGPDDNKAKYRCEASNSMLAAPLVAEVVMSVQCKFFFFLCFNNNYSIIFYIKIQKIIQFYYLKPKI